MRANALIARILALVGFPTAQVVAILSRVYIVAGWASLAVLLPACGGAVAPVDASPSHAAGASATGAARDAMAGASADASTTGPGAAASSPPNTGSDANLDVWEASAATPAPDGAPADDVGTTALSDASGMDASADGPPPCQPRTCKEAGYDCGSNADGCGGILNCGTCKPPAYCGGGGFSRCGPPPMPTPDAGPPCIPTTCAALGYSCGPNMDGCGGVLQCGSCKAPEYCGGGGYSRCGQTAAPDGGMTACVPKTCAELGPSCGPQGDGCGGLVPVCGTGGALGPCSGPPPPPPPSSCVPHTCEEQHLGCGLAGDGCGNAIDCGVCPAP